MDRLVETIKTLAEIPGASGDEGKVRNMILSMITGHADDINIDPLGNMIAFKKGKAAPANKIMYCAHMDEVGFIITHITENGLLGFATVGGVDSRVIVGKSVEVGDNRLCGVIGAKAYHHADDKEREESIPVDKLFIDIGASAEPEAEKHVSVGDYAVFHAEFAEFGEGSIVGKALDDRAGCALLIDLIRSELPYDSHFVFSVQEEVGCIGAVTAGYTVEPDISIVVEATTASDIAGVSSDKEVCVQGKGAVISFMDRGAVYDRELFALALETAKKKGIPTQVKTGVFGGNDSRSIQTARGGTRIMAVNMPCRYIHSPSNTLRVSDIHDTRNLLLALCESVANA